MSFIDLTWISVTSGDGGRGHMSFRREKFVPLGGPDGGNGGNGGDVIIEADKQLGTLLDFTYRRHYKAEHGQPGSRSNCTGRSGNNTIVKVPCGTVVRNKTTGEDIVDMHTHGQQFTVAKGGRGGRGNSEFVTSVNQAPRNAEPGTPGEEVILELELKLIADIGLVGYPNVGKSTLISAMSAAKPKIADYAFTTLVPNLGMVRAGEYRSFVMADIPGLIEGAHEGKGLGHQFLRHVERSAALVYIIDCQSEDYEQDFQVLKNELIKYEPAMAKKEYLVCMSKCDILGAELQKELEQHPFVKSTRAHLISAATNEGLKPLMEAMWGIVEKNRRIDS